MGWLHGVVVAYALLNLGGGVAGYISKGSKESLIAGLATGVLLLVAAFIAKGNPKIGFGLAALLALATGGFFVTRYMKSHAVWPPLVMIIVSVLVLIALTVGHFMSSQPNSVSAQ